MKKIIKNLFMHLVINSIFSIMFLLLYLTNLNFGLIILILSYILYIILIDEKDIITNQISLLIVLNVFYDMLWRKTLLDVPLELKYLIDFMSIILLFKIILHRNKYKLVFKDSIVILTLIWIVISMIISFSNNVSLYNYIMSLRIYIRFLPIYIILSNNRIFYNKYDLYLLILINIVIIPIQSMISFMDDRSGVFGISNVQALLLFLIIMTAVVVTMYSNKKINIFSFILCIILMFIICGVAEIKIGMVIIPGVIVLILLLNTRNPIKIVVSIMSIIIMVNIGISILIKVTPGFSTFFEKDKLKQNVINYTMKTNDPRFYLGRLQNIFYTNEYLLKDKEEKIFGLGVGSSMPSENYYYELRYGQRNLTPYCTNLYKQYGVYFGYHFSSVNIIYLESGYIGIIIYFSIIFIVLYRSFKILFRENNIKYKCITNATIVLTLAWIGLAFYYPYLLDRTSMLILIFMIGLNNSIFNLKYNRINKNLKDSITNNILK